MDQNKRATKNIKPEEVLEGVEKQYTLTKQLREQIKEMSEYFVCPKEQYVNQGIYGNEILKMGYQKIKRKNIIVEVDPEELYEQDVIKVFPFNWEKEFQDVYRKQGIIGLLSSINAIVPSYIKAGKELYPHLYNENGQCLPFEPFLVLRTMEPTWAEKNRIKKQIDG